jgi:hypothetical protein
MKTGSRACVRGRRTDRARKKVCVLKLAYHTLRACVQFALLFDTSETRAQSSFGREDAAAFVLMHASTCARKRVMGLR